VDEMKTRPFRIPVADIEEIRTIANKLQINLTAAFQIWKRKKKEKEFNWKEI
jgi:hypothetical protein